MQGWMFEFGFADGGTSVDFGPTSGTHDANWLADALKSEALSSDEVLFNASFNDEEVTDLEDVVVTGTRWPIDVTLPGGHEVNPGLVDGIGSGGGVP